MLRDLPSDLWYRLRALVRPGAAERDLHDELRFHVEHETESLVRQGVPPDEARRRALLAFGGLEPVKEASREVRGWTGAGQAWRDLRHALRLARRHPAFSLVVVLSLGLGLGAATAVFNITWNVLFAPLPVSHPEQLVALMRGEGDDLDPAFRWSEVRALRAEAGLGAFVTLRGASAVSVETDQRRVFLNMDFVDGGFFPLLGIAPLAGRLVTPADDSAGAPVIVLGEVLARRLFAGGAAVGRVVRVRGAPFTVIGVLPRRYRGLYAGDMFSAAIPQGAVPWLAQSGGGTDSRGLSYGPDVRQTNQRAFAVIGRLAVTREVAQQALGAAFARLPGRPGTGHPLPLSVMDIRRGIPGSKQDVRAGAGPVLGLLMGGMVLVLIVVCCNIAGLLLVRASAREREIAVRLSLGASRRRLVGQLVMESVPLALLGALLAFVLARAFSAALAASLPGDWDNIGELIAFDAGPAVLLFLGGAGLLSAFGFTLYPAIQATRQELGGALRVHSSASRSRGQGRVARGAIVAQVAGTLVLVTTTSLLAISVINLFRVDGGYAIDGVLLLTVETRSTPFERAGALALLEPVGRELRAVPGVRQAAMATMLPLYGGANAFAAIGVPGFTGQDGGPPYERYIAVTPGLLAAEGVPLAAGRDFTDADRAGGEPVVIVNRAFARRYFRGEEPVDRSLGFSAWTETPRPVRIVGLVEDVKLFGLRDGAEPLVYVAASQVGGEWSSFQLVVRTDNPPMSLARAVEQAIDRAAPGVNVRRVRDMRTQRDWALAVERLSARLAAFTSLMALALSAVGLYGVVAYSTARRTSELGLRMALGARARSIVWLVVRETLTFLALGLLIGLPLAFGAGLSLAAQLYGVEPRNPLPSIAAALVLGVVALLASALPARRAAGIDPRIALSAE